MANKSRRTGRGALYKYRVKAGERWRWQLYVPNDSSNPEAGTKRLGGGGFRTADEADEALREALTKLKNQEVISGSSTPTVASYSARWLESLHLENSTIYGYQKIVRNHVLPYLGDIRLDRLTATRLSKHYRDLQERGRKDFGHEGEGLSANTVNKVHIVIGAILDAAIDDGYISQNQARKRRTVQAPTGRQIRAEKPEIETWTSAQLKAFLDWDKNILNDELFTLWRCIAWTGIRRGEALALRWSDLDVSGKRISIRRAADTIKRNVAKTTKTGTSRVIDLDDETVSELKAWKALRGSVSLDLARPTAYIFGNLDNEIRSPNEVTARWAFRVRRAREELGEDVLSSLTLKGLRHTHATLMLELGVHPKVVQERLGHSNITTTMNIYSHVTPTMQRSAVEKLSEQFAGA